MKKITFLVLLSISIFTNGNCQINNFWNITNQSKIQNIDKLVITSNPAKFHLFQIDFNLLKSELQNVPLLKNHNSQNGKVFSFPNSDGELKKFYIYQADVMNEYLANRFQEIKSYVGMGIDDPTARIRFSVTLFGLNAMTISGKNHSFFIDPYTKDLNTYMVYSKEDITNNYAFECESSNLSFENNLNLSSVLSNNGIFRTYRLAISTTLEYSNYHIGLAGLSGGTTAQKKAAVLAAIVVTMTRVNAIFEKELAVTMQLVANNDLLISIDSDDFTNNNATQLMTQNQLTTDNLIGISNYDIGHIFSTAAGGKAQLGSVCSSTSKAKAATGTPTPVGDSFNVDYVSHEMGHQFGAHHTFNGNQGFCSGNANYPATGNLGTSVEPGSGSTIMGYAGICSPQNVQTNSDAYFSVDSLLEIDSFINSLGNCSANVFNNNAAPIIIPLQNYTIPNGTAFVLKGNGTDLNNPSTTTFCWEQTDAQISIQPPLSTNITGPSFRSLTPKISPDRYLPVLSSVIAGNLAPTWEVIPTVARTLNFALTVRDNATPNGGQTNTQNMIVTVASVGPFSVLTPNTNVAWLGNSTQTITWNVAGTIANGINTANVKILLSTDGGMTFPTVIAASTSNDGTENINVPNVATSSNCRIMIEGVGNIFYAVNPTNFTVTFNLATADFQTDNFSVFPNPSNGSFNIQFNKWPGEKLAIKIYDLSGKLIYDENYLSSDGLSKKIQLKNFSSGIYLLNVSSGNFKETKKITIN